jgi:hypothetical protein
MNVNPSLWRSKKTKLKIREGWEKTSLLEMVRNKWELNKNTTHDMFFQKASILEEWNISYSLEKILRKNLMTAKNKRDALKAYKLETIFIHGKSSSYVFSITYRGKVLKIELPEYKVFERCAKGFLKNMRCENTTDNWNMRKHKV